MPSVPSQSPRRAAVLAALFLAACQKEPVVEVIPGVNTTLEVVLLNPTDCPVCDPFADIDTLRLEVSVGDDVVASDNFAYPGEEVVLPDLADFGVVRVTLLGLLDGRVLSAGRTPEIVLLPDEALSVPLVFLPANRALPLASDMVTDRYRHAAIPRRDGAVLLVGGLDPMRERASGVTEVYDPATGVFTEFTPLPTGAVAAPVVAALPEGASLVSGGYAVVGGGEVPVEDTVVFDDTSGAFVSSGPLSEGREGHCLAMFRERQGIVLGGAPTADYLKPDPDSGAWSFTSIEMRDFDAEAVTDCAVLSDGVVYVQGTDAASTGTWSADAEDPGAAFTAITEGAAGDFRYVRGPALLPSADGGMRVLGGADATTGEVFADGRLYVPDAKRFVPIDGFRNPRFDPQVVPWISDGAYVAGCGWADADRVEDEPTVEIIAPEEGFSSPPLALDRDRPGCALAVLPDGAILVTGGGEVGPPAGAAAAILVPYLDVASGG